jgi:hypothetical protein
MVLSRKKITPDPQMVWARRGLSIRRLGDEKRLISADYTDYADFGFWALGMSVC